MALHSVSEPELPPENMPAAGEEVVLDIILGPRTDWFTAETPALMEKQCWEVSSQSNRIGLRLRAEEPIERVIVDELPSEGTVPGAIQVPPSGQPVIFLADHPLTGGYPVVGCVADHHLDLAGQIPAGSLVRFRVIRPFERIFSLPY
jgi:allophanate hydrolase subunit 2